MKELFETIQSVPLFHGIAYDDFMRVFTCLSARVACYEKGEIIMLTGDDVAFMGVIISGGVTIIKEDERGNVSMLSELSESEMFGEVLACAGIYQSPVTILAAEDTKILQISNRKIISLCSAVCLFHTRLLENMLGHIARKNFMLSRKIEILSKRTIKEKLLCFLDLQSRGEKKFSISYNREEMAHYLCVDRSAMSNELCKMRDEGLIKFHKNKFEVLY